MSELPVVPGTRCIHFCSKALSVYGENYCADADFQAGMDQTWCVLTARTIGPDDGDVGWSECSNPQRECFREY
jgi:hypothetical protein